MRLVVQPRTNAPRPVACFLAADQIASAPLSNRVVEVAEFIVTAVIS